MRSRGTIAVATVVGKALRSSLDDIEREYRKLGTEGRLAHAAEFRRQLEGLGE